jgi:hypothetical protein
MLIYSTDLPYILPERMMRIKDATFEEGCRPKKVKSFARLAIKLFAIRETCTGKPVTKLLLQL